MAGVTGVTGVTGLPEGDGRTLVCRWPTGIPASHLPPALLSDTRTPNERIRLCVASAWRNCLAHSARCERRTAHSAHTAHCTGLLTVYLRGRLAGAGTSPSPLTLSPLTTHHSPFTTPPAMQSHTSSLPLLQCCYPAHRRASPNTLSLLFFTLIREHSHLVVVSAPHIQRGHRNQPLSFATATANESVMIDDSITARKRQAGVSSHADSSR